MAKDAEVARLIVRLTGDGTPYKKMLSEATQQTKKFSTTVKAEMKKVSTAIASSNKAMKTQTDKNFKAMTDAATKFSTKFVGIHKTMMSKAVTQVRQGGTRMVNAIKAAQNRAKTAAGKAVFGGPAGTAFTNKLKTTATKLAAAATKISNSATKMGQAARRMNSATVTAAARKQMLAATKMSNAVTRFSASVRKMTSQGTSRHNATRGLQAASVRMESAAKLMIVAARRINDSTVHMMRAAVALGADITMLTTAVRRGTGIGSRGPLPPRVSTVERGRRMVSAGRSMTMHATLPIATAMGFAIREAIKEESSFTEIKKTVAEAVDEQGKTTPIGEEIRQGLRDMSKEIPINVNELMKVAAAAGRLGIETDSILDFTKVMASMGVTTDMSSEMAADELARLANITDMSHEDFDNLASSIVHLGNTFPAAEGEIVEFSKRLAGAGHLAGMTEADIVGIASALGSVGLKVEAGATAFSRVIKDMHDSVQSLTGETVDNTHKIKDELISIRKLENQLSSTTQEFQGLASGASASDLALQIAIIDKLNQRIGSTQNVLSGAASVGDEAAVNRHLATLKLLQANLVKAQEKIQQMSAGADPLKLESFQVKILEINNSLDKHKRKLDILKSAHGKPGGTESLQIYAQTAGMTAEAFAKLHHEDPAKALDAFVQGLGQLHREGGDVIGVLKDLGHNDVRISAALEQTSGAQGLLTKTLEESNKAWKENIALMKEANLFFNNTAGRLIKFVNRVRLVAIDLGEMLIPALEKVVSWLEKGIEWWKGLDAATQKNIVIAAGVVAAMGPITTVMGTVTMGVGMAINAFTVLLGTFKLIISSGPALYGVMTAAVGLLTMVAFQQSSIMRELREAERISDELSGRALARVDDRVTDLQHDLQGRRVGASFRNRGRIVPLTDAEKSKILEDAVAAQRREVAGSEASVRRAQAELNRVSTLHNNAINATFGSGEIRSAENDLRDHLNMLEKNRAVLAEMVSMSEEHKREVELAAKQAEQEAKFAKAQLDAEKRAAEEKAKIDAMTAELDAQLAAANKEAEDLAVNLNKVAGPHEIDISIKRASEDPATAIIRAIGMRGAAMREAEAARHAKAQEQIAFENAAFKETKKARRLAAGMERSGMDPSLVQSQMEEVKGLIDLNRPRSEILVALERLQGIRAGDITLPGQDVDAIRKINTSMNPEDFNLHLRRQTQALFPGDPVPIAVDAPPLPPGEDPEVTLNSINEGIWALVDMGKDTITLKASGLHS